MKQAQHQDFYQEFSVALKSIAIKLLDCHYLQSNTTVKLSNIQSSSRLHSSLLSFNHVKKLYVIATVCIPQITEFNWLMYFVVCLSSVLQAALVNTTKSTLAEERFWSEILCCSCKLTECECLSCNVCGGCSIPRTLLLAVK